MDSLRDAILKGINIAMNISSFLRERLACAYFFAIPGIVYGIFTGRMPAIKNMVDANDSQIGLLLLAFGLASFTGLLVSRRVIGAFEAKNVLGASALFLSVGMVIATMTSSYMHLVSFCMFSGLATGLAEVAMNAKGMEIEARYGRLCMASLHACFSLGGLAGSLCSSLFAARSYSPALNFAIVLGVFFIGFPFAFRHMAKSGTEASSTERQRKGRLPLFICLCGLLSMLCYVSEGSVGEWGSILLHSSKGAPQDEAALVFGCFCVTMVIFRFLGDRLRLAFGDVPIVLCGGILGAASMSVVLLSPSSLICLGAYMVMGIGFAPIVPILFSRAGQYPGVSITHASSAMSVMSYTGLLVFPPLLGMLGDAIGLDKSLWIITAACLCIAIGGGSLLARANRF